MTFDHNFSGNIQILPIKSLLISPDKNMPTLAILLFCKQTLAALVGIFYSQVDVFRDFKHTMFHAVRFLPRLPLLHVSLNNDMQGALGRNISVSSLFGWLWQRSNLITTWKTKREHLTSTDSIFMFSVFWTKAEFHNFSGCFLLSSKAFQF